MDLSPLKRNPKCVVKLHLGNKGTRRIPFHKLWNIDSNVLSFETLVDLAFKYSNVTRTSLSSFTISYNDEDGDTITISSDEELADAYEQFVEKVPPVMHAFANLNGKVVDLSNSFQMRNKCLRNVVQRPGRKLPLNQERKKGAQEMMRPRSQCLADQILFLQNKEFAILRRKDKLIQEMRSCKDQTVSDTEEKPEVEELKSNDDEVKSTKKQKTTPASSSTTEEKTMHIPDSFDPNFIHGRHTCDGCFSTPIIGYRFNAINRSDYDLCHVCYKNYKGDIRFLPEQLERDVPHQQRWHKRQLRACRRNMTHDQLNANPYRTLKEDLKETCRALVDEVQGLPCMVNGESSLLTNDGENKHNIPNACNKYNETSTTSVGDNSSNTSRSDTKYSRSDQLSDEIAERLLSNAISGISVDEIHVESPDLVCDKELLANLKKTMESSETLSSTGSVATMIVDGFVSDESEVKSNKDPSKDDEWEVVNENKDALVVQATEMLGSALFNSCDNIATSVIDKVDIPNDSSNVTANDDNPNPKKEISPVLLTMWEDHLYQLHSMGFVDDHANIDALEHLKAADMGVNSDDEPRIEAVVTVLLNRAEGMKEEMKNV